MVARTWAVMLLSLLFAAGPATGQSPADRNCQDDRGVDRCSDDQQRRVRTLFGVRSIEEHRAAGDEVRRVFYIDGYGRDIVLVAFVRAPGRDPTVWVHYPRREGEAQPEPLQAQVPLGTWNGVIERSANFHRRFVQPGTARAPADEDDGAIEICIHSWVYTIEAVDRAAFGGHPQIRRKTEDACENGPGEEFAQQLDELARSLFPHCAALDVEQYRNAAMALSACRILHGDRLAAAEVLNRADPFTNVQGPDDARLLAGVFDDDATIDWGGERHAGAYFESTAFWAARLRGAEGRTTFFIHAVEGVDGGRVRLTGSLTRPMAGASEQRDRYETATVEQIWTRVNGGEWLVERAAVGRWRPDSED